MGFASISTELLPARHAGDGPDRKESQGKSPQSYQTIRPERRIFISAAIIVSDWLKTPASFYRCVQDQESGNPGADFRTPQPRAG
jgi:hypothetical protein